VPLWEDDAGMAEPGEEDARKAYLRRTRVRLLYERRSFIKEFIDFLDERDLDRADALLRPLMDDLFYNAAGRRYDRRGED
jgi:hypothetical protein